jgi:uncharacterized membrane protein YfcA
MRRSPQSSRLSFFLVLAVFWVGWLAIVIPGGAWSLFRDYWFMTATMCVGSFIAGATSEGGGAVAFPVMTLLFGIDPSIARDFSLMIQSVGMTAASVLIFCFGIRVEWRAILFAGIGGTLGIIVGLSYVAPLCEPSFVKIFFTSLWLSFAVALYGINRDQKRCTSSAIQQCGPRECLLLMAIGVIGGIVSSLTGSGLDIMTFALLTLLFRVSEKIATPTSVVLMAGNAIVGFAWRGVIQNQLPTEAWNYWYVCIPVVVAGAPMGAYFIRWRTRQFVARVLYASIVVQFAAALVIVPQTPSLLIVSGTTFGLGVCLFGSMALAGGKRRHREATALESRLGLGGAMESNVLEAQQT